MLKPRWPTAYPDPRDAIPVLLGAAEAGRLNDRGEVDLTADEAGVLQQAGYTAILGAGRWPAPHIPLDLLRRHPSLAPLALYWYGPGALDPPPPPARPRCSCRQSCPRALSKAVYHALLKSMASSCSPWLRPGAGPQARSPTRLGTGTVRARSARLPKCASTFVLDLDSAVRFWVTRAPVRLPTGI